MIDTPRRVPHTSLRLSAVQYGAHALACRQGRGLEHGFALITVLWLITALVGIVGLSLSAVRLGNQATTNRLVLARGRWAAEACGAIAQARWVQHRFIDTATIDLGRGAHCAWRAEDLTAMVNLNVADPEVLHSLGASEAFVRALVERRRLTPLEAIEEAAALPGFDSTLIGALTVDGPGTVNLSAAPRRVLATLPGLRSEAVDRLLYAREVGRPITNLDELAAQLSPPGRAALLARYADLVRATTFSSPQLELTLSGWVDGFAPRAQIELSVVPLTDRLAVVRRRQW